MASSNRYNLHFSVFICIITSDSLVEASDVIADKTLIIVLCPFLVSLVIAIVILTCCLWKRCKESANAGFGNMVSSSSSASFVSSNSPFYNVASEKGFNHQRKALRYGKEIITIDLSQEKKIEVMNTASELRHSANGIHSVQKNDADDTIHRKSSMRISFAIEPSQNDTSQTSERFSAAQEKFTVRQLKSSSDTPGLDDSSEDIFTLDTVNNDCDEPENGVTRFDTVLVDKRRTISATSEGDYYDLDDEEVEKSIEREDSSSQPLTPDEGISMSFPTTCSKKRPLPEITETLEIVMENELYSSL